MKKIFITFLAFLYLVAGIGHGNVQHHCQKNPDVTSKCDSLCCSDDPECGSPGTSRQSENPELPSCCQMTVSTLPDATGIHVAPDDCCNDTHEYNQLETSYLPVIIGLKLVDFTVSEIHLPYHLTILHSDGSDREICSNPAAPVNRPLLI